MTTVEPQPPRPRTPAQIEAARANGARSLGPVTPEGKARSALNGTRHGLCSVGFFLLPDEDPEAYALFLADFLHLLRPRDAIERQAVERAAQARWREIRADRLEAEILAELFAAKDLAEEAEARAVRAAATKALGTLLRYRHRIQRDADRALAEFEALRRRRAFTAPQPRPEAARTSEPEVAAARPPAPPAAVPAALPVAPELPSEPERPLNRHERRRLEALRRKAGFRLAA